MKKSISLWQFFGFIFTGIAGVLLHFLYDWSNQNILFAPFSAVNESIWEHMKLLFFPMFVFALVQSRAFGKVYGNFWCIKLLGIVVGVTLIPVLFYSYTGILGLKLDWVNIAIFFIAAGITYLLEARLLKKNKLSCKSPKAALGALWLLAVIFVVLTFVPPHIPLFEDPVTKTYGVI